METANKAKIQISLDQATLDCLDYIEKHVPEVESRSAAIRWAVRTGVWKLRTYDAETSKRRLRS